jgi:predicted RNase H-like HicB family nuclease
MSNYVVLYETAEDGTISAYVPDLRVVLASGRNHDEVRQSILKGIRIYLEEMAQAGHPMPEPSMSHEVLAV